MKKNKDAKGFLLEKQGLITAIYIVLMIVFFLGYIFLDNYRLVKSEHWLSTNNLTQEDIQRIQELGTWTTSAEFLFLGLFLLTAITLVRYWKNRRVLNYFIILHLFLFLALFGLGYGLSLILIIPIGNATQPLMLPTFLLLIIVIYVIFLRLIGQLANK